MKRREKHETNRNSQLTPATSLRKALSMEVESGASGASTFHSCARIYIGFHSDSLFLGQRVFVCCWGTPSACMFFFFFLSVGSVNPRLLRGCRLRSCLSPSAVVRSAIYAPCGCCMPRTVKPSPFNSCGYAAGAPAETVYGVMYAP